MASVVHENRPLTRQHFEGDRHASRYLGALGENREAFDDLLAILNDPANEQRLIDAERNGRPALAGVVRMIERNPVIASLLESGESGHRFRQGVGVAVRLKMENLGWSKTGRKGAVPGRFFTKAERYEPPRESGSYADRVKSALDGLSAIGDDAERAETAELLYERLAETRAAEGRPF